MSAQQAKSFSFTFPFFIAVLLVWKANGVAQTIAAVVAAISTTIFVHLAARYVWAPLLKRRGFWKTTVLLGIALVVVSFGAAIARIKMGDPRELWEPFSLAAIAGLLFSWSLAAMRGAEDGKNA
jgi:4-amino-4-deoxy-L-arabinose transferase-like glycosyltransferase